MFGSGINGVFRSRWKALWWAAGVCMTAYCSIPQPGDEGGLLGMGGASAAAPQTPAEQAASQKAAQEAAAQLEQTFGGGTPAKHSHREPAPEQPD